MELATFDDFQEVDIRIGTIISVEPFPEAEKSAYKLKVDFGALGEKMSSAQITARYSLDDLQGKKVLAVVNFPTKKIAGFKSEVLILGVPNEEKEIVLLTPEAELPNGSAVR